MKINIITVGEPKLSFVKEGFSEYIKRLEGYHKVQVTHIKENNQSEKKTLDTLGNVYAIVLDEKGKEFSSSALAEFLEKKALEGIGEMTFVIGGPDGHTEAIKERADLLLSLSKLTFPHDMAMLVLTEALYRASSITAGHPYHRF